MQTALAVGVIDDDDSFRVALVESLSSLGFEARGYAAADDFIAGNGQGLCNLVITDVHMPGMSGLDLIRHLAASGWKMPVVLITARSDPHLEARAAAAGAACFLKKPFETRKLIECIERVMGRE